MTLKVPVGTQVLDEDNETVLADLTEEGQKVRIARGGNGGFGNARFKSSTNRAPRHANPGEDGVEMWLWLRLKLIADAGLVGLPNAGKSTMLAAVSAAKPKIADYPFTTLHPQLGVVRVGTASFVLADIPGLIEGAHAGAGIGDRFRGHIERCAVILHLVDACTEDPAADYQTIRNELISYGAGIEDKREVVALNKIDAADPEKLDDAAKALKKLTGQEPLRVSGVTGEGVDKVLASLLGIIEERRERDRELAEAGTGGWQP